MLVRHKQHKLLLGYCGITSYSHYGFPEQFISDQGRNFESDLIKELCKITGVKKLHNTPYHPQSNGQCERFNSTLCNMLGTLSDEEKSDWKSHLGCMTHAYNCTKHVSTTYSPYYLMFGRHPRLPIDVEFGLHNPIVVTIVVSLDTFRS